MTETTHSQAQQARESTYAKHIRLLQLETDQVPIGWRRTYVEVTRNLLARDCAARSELTVTGPFVDAGEIAFWVSGNDACVAGILRKAAARMRGQCQVCGAPARMRVIGIKRRPLCAECYAPRALSAELTRLLRDQKSATSATGSPSLYAEHELSPRIRALVPDSSWRHVRSECGNEVARCLTAHDLHGISGWLRAVQERLREIAAVATPEECKRPGNTG